jgi:hypothetical protein
MTRRDTSHFYEALHYVVLGLVWIIKVYFVCFVLYGLRICAVSDDSCYCAMTFPILARQSIALLFFSAVQWCWQSSRLLLCDGTMGWNSCITKHAVILTISTPSTA